MGEETLGKMGEDRKKRPVLQPFSKAFGVIPASLDDGIEPARLPVCRFERFKGIAP